MPRNIPKGMQVKITKVIVAAFTSQDMELA